jgi:asparagine synthase (glutamine-hydrolysing)
MCGICGIVSLADSPGWSEEPAVAAMIGALAHRGPDGHGITASAGALLGATRLAIRGSIEGRQPIEDVNTGVVVVCNGEIDNHDQLRTWLAARGRDASSESDVAVLPGMYLELGARFVERLVGAFAIAVWDPRSRELLLARDRVGERPLYYTVMAGEASFATEVAALATKAELTLDIDRGAIGHYARYGRFAAPESPFAQIRKVAPGEIVRIDCAGATSRRYWRWNMTTAPKARPDENDFDVIFREAVRLQSEVDVPYGVFLSGGVDSSLVAAVARQVRPHSPLSAYTLRFGEASYDEGDYAERVARHLDLPVVEVRVTPELVPGELRSLIASSGEPLGDPAWIPTALLARRAAQDVKLALVGEGADELFGGYPTYIGAEIASRYAALPSPLRAAVRAVAGRIPASDRKVSLSFLFSRFIDGAELEPVARHLLWTSNIQPELLARLGIASEEQPRVLRESGSLLDRLQQHDLETSLAEGLLTKSDRAGMQSAVELRAPFLDPRVLAFAATVPSSARVRGIHTKRFLKRYALKYLPGDIVHRRKRGLSVPLSAWLRGPLASWAHDRLSSPRLASVGVIPREACGLFDEHRARRADHARALWTLIVLSEWLEWVDRRVTT